MEIRVSERKVGLASHTPQTWGKQILEITGENSVP